MSRRSRDSNGLEVLEESINEGDFSDRSMLEDSRGVSSIEWQSALNRGGTEGWSPDHNYARSQISCDDGLRTPPSSDECSTGYDTQSQPDELIPIRPPDVRLSQQPAATQQRLRPDQQSLHAAANQSVIPQSELLPIDRENAMVGDDIMAAFAVRRQSISHPVQRHHNPHDISIESELKKWLSDRNGLVMTSGKTINGKETKPKPESMQFWHRQYEKKNYVLYPLVARIVFAVPASSAQIERKFGNSGQLVTALRASTSPQNIDMACFLHQNRSFVEICQCPKLSAAEIEENLPTNVKFNLEPETIERMDWGQMEQDFFSTSIISALASDDDESKDN